MMAEPKPRRSPVEAKTTLIGIPIPVIKVADGSSLLKR